MNKTLLNVKMLYKEMGASEKKIADFILENPTGLIPLSISEFADKCGSSDATVVRFSRRLGYSGYQQLKISLAQEENASGITEAISANDSPETVFEKVCNDIYCSLEKTKKLFDPEVFKAAADAIINADRILIFGSGNSSSVAEDMAHKLLRLGYNAVSYSDSHMQAIAAAHVKPGCTAIAVSHSGSSKDVVNALKLAKTNGAVTVAITNAGKSPVYLAADYVLTTVSDEINYSVLGLNSRITQLALIDAVYYYAMCRVPAAKSEADKTEKALLDMKY